MTDVRRATAPVATALLAAALAIGGLGTGCRPAVAGARPVLAAVGSLSPAPVPVHARTPATSADVVTVAADFPPPIVRPSQSAHRRPWRTLPDGTHRLLPGHRVVAYYGAAGAPELGVLGTAGPSVLWPRLARQARAYRTHDRDVLPAYELIAFAATGSRGNQGNYSSRVPAATLDRYARAARRHHALLILDIQPGRGRFLADAKKLRPWLRLPYVGLALDPEWKLYGAERPLQHIGHTDAPAVNAVSRWLNRLTVARRLPQKLLLIHEFTDDMVRHKGRVAERPHLATVFNVDGFGGAAEKIGKYREFSAGRRTPLGFKLFYDADLGLLSPRAVLRLHPAPVVVEYQ